MKALNYPRNGPILILITLLLTGTACSELLPSISDPGDDCANECFANTTMIIGCDNRVIKPDSLDGATTAPWHFTGRFHKKSPRAESAQGHCSGTLIAGRYVLTAAHCLIGQGNNQLGFALAQEQISVRPFGTYGVSRVFVPVAYQNSNDENDQAYDYAIAELREPITGAVPAQWGYVDWNILKFKPVFTAGYPGTEPDGLDLGRPWITEGVYHNAQPFGWLDDGEAGLLYTNLDGTAGQSGSPVYSFLLPSQHPGEGIIRKVTGVLIGSPVAACMQDQMWVASLTPGAIEHIENAMAFDSGVTDPFWEVIDLPASPTSDPGKPWP